MYWLFSGINDVPTIRLVEQVISGFVDGEEVVRVYFVGHPSYYDIFPGTLGINDIWKRIIYAMQNVQAINELILVSESFWSAYFDPIGSVCCDFDDEN